MRIERKDPPRVYEVGWGEPVHIRDCGTVHLDADEQVTFVTEAGGEYDLARKEWGFYATPSLNSRLPSFDLRPVLVRNRIDRYFVLLLESGHEAAFERYIALEELTIIAWLDDNATMARLSGTLDG